MPIHDDLAAGRQEGKASFDLPLQTSSGVAGEGTKLRVEAELLAVIADEVEDGEHRFGSCTAEAAAELE